MTAALVGCWLLLDYPWGLCAFVALAMLVRRYSRQADAAIR